MKTRTILALIATIPFALVSCSDKESGGGSDNDSTASAGKYPIDTCVVSDEKLGSMGEPVEVVHKGTTVKFCCDSCIPEFNKDPDTYIAKLKK